MPKISVIIPVYKTAKYMKKCIDSVINQTFSDIEIILVSDGPDEEHKICDEYAQKDARITVIKNVNKGLGGARNAGIDVAKGEYISFVDSDDWIEPETYEKALACFSDDVDLVVFDTAFYNNCKITQKRIDEENYISLKYEGLVDINRDSIFNTNVHAWNKLWKKAMIDKYNVKFPDFVCFEDFPFYFKYVFNIKKAFYLNEKLYVYNRRDNSLMAQTYNKKRFEQNKIHITSCEFLFHELKKIGLYEQCEELFIELFERWVNVALYHSKKFDRRKIKKLACKTIKKLDLNVSQSEYLTKMKGEFGMKMKWYQYLFSIVNTENGYKKITCLGIKIKIKKENNIDYILSMLESIKKENVQNNDILLKIKSLQCNKKKSILFITHEFSISGAPTILIPVIDYFKNKGYDVAVLSFKEGILKYQFIQANIPIFILKDVITEQENFIELANKFTAVFCNTVDSYAAYYLIKKCTTAKAIWWLHEGKCIDEYHITHFKGGNGIPELNQILKIADNIYCVSDYQKSFLKKYNTSIKLLPYGIKDIKEKEKNFTSAKKHSEKLVFSIFGIVQKRKAQEFLIDTIMKSMHKDDIILNIVGDYQENIYARNLYNKTCNEANIIWHGFVSEEEKYKIYKETDICVCISEDDPMPRVVTDAMMFGIPVILSDNVGQYELVIDGISGFKINTNNTNDLLKVIDKIFSLNNGELEKIGKNSRAIYEKNFSEQAFEAELDKLRYLVEENVNV